MRLALVSASLLALASLAWPVAAQDAPASVSTAPAVDENILPEESGFNLIGGLVGLQAAVVYPASAREARTEGVVIVRFVVSEMGTPTDLVVVRSLTPETDAEALRVIRLARFVPFQQNGQPVTPRITLPVSFALRPHITPVRVAAVSAVTVAAVTLVGAVVMFLTGGPWNNQ
ncbi:MAG TPA: energy transducer TonB [Rubricoccaceae bacterium]|jgi:TonB family protein